MKHPHIIELKDFQNWLSEDHEVIYASSSRERKKLTARVLGGYAVYVAGTIVWEGTQPFSAVEAYNNIIDKYDDEKTKFVL